jgi:hypothetical protein
MPLAQCVPQPSAENKKYIRDGQHDKIVLPPGNGTACPGLPGNYHIVIPSGANLRQLGK